jgi:hypothetical protein
MFQISRALYRELAADLPADADRSAVLQACEETVGRLVHDRHYFAHPARSLFADIRRHFPLAAQRRVYAVVERHLGATRQYLESSNEAMVLLTGERPTCRATTRRRGLCSHEPDPRTGYCRWHSHLVCEDEAALAA